MRHSIRTGLILWFVVTGCRAVEPTDTSTLARISAVEALAGGTTEGYALASAPRDLAFPQDHGPHPEFKTEWWYFTGHLASPAGRRFGYQLTFFRQAITPEMLPRSSTWATRQLYMAHFALSDIDGGSFRSFERLGRGAAGLAGAGRNKPFQVWLEDWSVESTGERDFPVRLRARSSAAGEVALDLVLDKAKPIVLHGDRGLSRKGTGAGNASFYYSLTRLPSRGRVTLGGEDFEVTGNSWLDREWSTSVLTKSQVGWDWFSLQLDDQRELMLFQLRLEGGAVDPISHGTMIEVDGSTLPLELEDFELTARDTWRSAEGVTYPAGWQLTVPSQDLDLTLEPLLADQELDVSFRYWEGAIEVSGTRGVLPVSGLGYAELVGYGE